MKSEQKNKLAKANVPQNAGSVKLPKPNKGQEIPMGLSFSYLRRHNSPKRPA